MATKYVDDGPKFQSGYSLYLQTLVKVANFAQVVEELVYPGLVVLDKGVEGHHVGLLGIGRLVGQVLEQLGNQCKSSSGVFAGQSIDEHVSLGGDNRWVDESQEEEASNQRANGKVGGIGVFSLMN